MWRQTCVDFRAAVARGWFPANPAVKAARTGILAIALLGIGAFASSCSPRPRFVADPWLADAEPELHAAFLEMSGGAVIYATADALAESAAAGMDGASNGLVTSPLLFAEGLSAPLGPKALCAYDLGFDESRLQASGASVVSISLLSAASDSAFIISAWIDDYRTRGEDEPVIAVIYPSSNNGLETGRAFVDAYRGLDGKTMLVERQLPGMITNEAVSTTMGELKGWNVRAAFLVGEAATPFFCSMLSELGILVGTDSRRADLAAAFRFSLDPETLKEGIRRALAAPPGSVVSVAPIPVPGPQAARFFLGNRVFSDFVQEAAGKNGGKADN